MNYTKLKKNSNFFYYSLLDEQKKRKPLKIFHSIFSGIKTNKLSQKFTNKKTVKKFQCSIHFSINKQINSFFYKKLSKQKILYFFQKKCKNKKIYYYLHEIKKTNKTHEKINLCTLDYSKIYGRRLHNLDKKLWFESTKIKNMFFKSSNSANKDYYFNSINRMLKNQSNNLFHLKKYLWKIIDSLILIFQLKLNSENYEKDFHKKNQFLFKYFKNPLNNFLDLQSYVWPRLQRLFCVFCIRSFAYFASALLQSKPMQNVQTEAKCANRSKGRKKNKKTNGQKDKCTKKLNIFADKKPYSFIFQTNKFTNLWVFHFLCYYLNRNLLPLLKQFYLKQKVKKQLFNHLFFKKSTNKMNTYFRDYETFLFFKNKKLSNRFFTLFLKDNQNSLPIQIIKNEFKVEFVFHEINFMLKLNLFNDINLFFMNSQEKFTESHMISFFLKSISILHFEKKFKVSKIKLLNFLMKKNLIFETLNFNFIFLLLDVIIFDSFLKYKQNFKRNSSNRNLYHYLMFSHNNQLMLLIYSSFVNIKMESFLKQFSRKYTFMFQKTNSWIYPCEATLAPLQKVEISVKNTKEKNLLQYLIPNTTILNYLTLIRTYLKQNKSNSQDKILQTLIFLQNCFFNFFHLFLNRKQVCYCDQEIRKYLWRWACRRHSNKSHNWIKNKYFQLFHLNSRFFRLFSIRNKNNNFIFSYPCHYDYLMSKSLLRILYNKFLYFNFKFKIELSSFSLTQIHQPKKIRTKTDINLFLLNTYTPCRT